MRNNTLSTLDFRLLGFWGAKTLQTTLLKPMGSGTKISIFSSISFQENGCFSGFENGELAILITLGYCHFLTSFKFFLAKHVFSYYVYLCVCIKVPSKGPSFHLASPRLTYSGAMRALDTFNFHLPVHKKAQGWRGETSTKIPRKR